MTGSNRGADHIARALQRAGVETVFTLSGNHIMPLFDALLDTGQRLIHVRHEAAAVHMADAWGRLTGSPGIALVTGGPGHTNAAAGLYTALAAESPMLLLSGHAGCTELGRGGFQEMRQADLAEPVCKASFTASTASTLGDDIARALWLASSGRPGPVHMSLPVDLLNSEDDGPRTLDPSVFDGLDLALSPETAKAAVELLGRAARPLILAAPALCAPPNRPLLDALQTAAGVPVIGMESPRGINDPSLGAFAEVLGQADRILLLGKPLDFTLKFGTSPAVDAACRWIVLDPDMALHDRALRALGSRIDLACRADPLAATRALTDAASGNPAGDAVWAAEVAAALSYRPSAWETARAAQPGLLHPIELCRGLAPLFENNPHAVLVCDGGEIGQWAQSLLAPPRRIINGVSGSIGASLPFALAARVAEPESPVIAVLGDGTAGFHLAEFETAVRHRLPFVAVVGNDSRWNAEYQIQLRDYGAQRLHNCELMPGTRYDQVVTALGGHGELVTDTAALPAAIDRSVASGLPACVNVMIEGVPAPVVRRTG